MGASVRVVVQAVAGRHSCGLSWVLAAGVSG